MCGIVGYTGTRPVLQVLLQGLNRLEYRGYDSSGVAFVRQGKFEILKSEGKLENVQKLVDSASDEAKRASVGMGHTRWATHGKPTTQNAHPHQTGHVILVANGIIENYQEIKARILKAGYQPKSETDSELFGFLVLDRMDHHGKSLKDAVRESFREVQGACSLVVMSEKEPGVMIGVRNGSPLVAAVDPSGGSFLASDAQALLEYTRKVYFIEHGDLVVGTKDRMEFFDVQTGKPVHRATTELDWTADKMDRQGYAHYMLKEIYEQPTALIDTLNATLDRLTGEPFALAKQPGAEILANAKQLVLVACGTSWHAALLGKYWLEQWARVPVEVEIASEFRYRSPCLPAGTVVVGISQSGETADTLAVLNEMKKQGYPTLGITNVRGSTISRETQAVYYTSAGPEIGVAATKTFTSQLLMFLLWAGFVATHKKTQNPEQLQKIFKQLIQLPHMLSDVLMNQSGMGPAVKKAASALRNSKGFFFIGRGYSYPIALEGALKLKEIAYVHAEGYPAGELKHGPIAMIDEEMVVVTLAPRDVWREKTISNLEEVKARGAIILGVGDQDDEALKKLCDHWVPLPHLEPELMPFALAPVIQLLSYEIAVLKGTDVDKPRNLAKSVTVE